MLLSSLSLAANSETSAAETANKTKSYSYDEQLQAADKRNNLLLRFRGIKTWYKRRHSGDIAASKSQDVGVWALR